MIQISDKKKCCGCTACFNICPRDAILMKPDEEGFLYPIIEKSRCINCGLCEKVCPILHKEKKSEEKTEGYIVRYKNADVVRESTSGGAFTAFAEPIIKQGGCVYGAGYDAHMKVVCKSVNSLDGLSEMRGSKFVQSDLGTVFTDIRRKLEDGIIILFTGTPCQIEGLHHFLRHSYDNLICIDFVCRGVPSPELWNNYVTMMERKYESPIVGAKFKNKTYGYHASTMKIEFSDGQIYYTSGRTDPFMRAFVNEMASRPCCSECAFKGVERKSDITIFDCYNYSAVTKKKDDDQGYTSMLIHSQKGHDFFLSVKNQLRVTKSDVDDMIRYNGIMACYSAKENPNRDEFYKLLKKHEIDTAIDIILPISKMDGLIERSKSMLHRVGLIKLAKKFKREKIITNE